MLHCCSLVLWCRVKFNDSNFKNISIELLRCTFLIKNSAADFTADRFLCCIPFFAPLNCTVWTWQTTFLPSTGFKYNLGTELCLLHDTLLHFRGECILTLNLSFCTHYISCTCPSWRGILLGCSPEGFFPFSPLKGYLGVFPDPMWVLGQGCLCVQIVKHSETNL